MHSTIILTDMHIRDERVYEFIERCVKAGGGRARLTHDVIATQFGCHRNTARAIVARLRAAEHIAVDDSAKRGGYIYSLMERHAERDRTR